MASNVCTAAVNFPTPPANPCGIPVHTSTPAAKARSTYRSEPKSRHAAERVFFECHIITRRDALHESAELPARFDPSCHASGVTGPGAHGGSDHGVLGIERRNYDNLRRCVGCSGFSRSQCLTELGPEGVYSVCTP